MGVLKTFTDELRRVQAERETQDLLEVLRRRLDVLTFGELSGLITSALGKQLASVKVSALLGPPSGLAGSPSKTNPASASTTATTPKPAKTPRPAAGKKAARKSKSKAMAMAASKQKAQPSKKAASKRTSATSRPAKGKKAAAKSSAPTSRRSSALLAAQDAVLRTLAASAEPLGIRGVLAGAKLSLSQANRTLRRLVESGEVRMIGPKQRATYTLAQGTGSVIPKSSAAPSPADAPAISKAARSPARVTGKSTAGREAYAGAILTALQGAGDWIGAANVRAKVGGTPEQMRQGLLRLVSAGAIVKNGERNNTRYKLAG